MNLDVTYDGPQFTKNNDENCITLYYKGQKIDDLQQLDLHDNEATFEIHNGSMAEMQNIEIKANFPIDHAEGPARILAGERGTITIHIDTEKMLYMPESINPVWTLQYKLVRIFGGSR